MTFQLRHARSGRTRNYTAALVVPPGLRGAESAARLKDAVWDHVRDLYPLRIWWIERIEVRGPGWIATW